MSDQRTPGGGPATSGRSRWTEGHGGVSQHVREATAEAGDAAKETASQVRASAQEAATGAVADAKASAAERLDHIARALRSAGETLREQHEEAIADYSDSAAGQVERFSRRMRDNDLRTLISDVEHLARQRPDVFLGGSLIAGVMLGRFLRASSGSEKQEPGSPGARHERPAS